MSPEEMEKKHEHKYPKWDKIQARKECCNFVNNACMGGHACWVLKDLDCPFYNRVVSQV